ncbi:hypothetical protein ACFLSG_04515 [Candidatus Bipolaricaulota bacterium]
MKETDASRLQATPTSKPYGNWIPSEVFADYAEADLDRWRQIIGHQVIHNDARWGIGDVLAVSLGACCDHVPAYVQIKIRYEGGWTVIGHSATWHQHHQTVSIPAGLDTVIRDCLDSGLSEDERAECLSRHARELRQQKDQETLDHAAQMKQRILARRRANAQSGQEDQDVGSDC